MDVAYRLGEVKAAEERMTDTLMIFLLFFYWLVDGFVLLSDVFCKFRIHQTTPFVNS